MSSSPFELFRRNLKPLMVLLTGLAMFAFVVLPVMDSYMRSNAGGGNDEVVASFGDVTVTRSRAKYFTQNHQSTVRFLRELADETIRRGGSPLTAGFQYDEQSGRMSLGINETPGTLVTIRTFQFSARASEAGFALDDAKIRDWLQKFSGDMFSDSEINGMWMRSTNNRLGPYHLYDQLRHQLLAGLYLRGALSTVSDGQRPMLTPSEQWDQFLKLNRKANVDVYAVKVDDFLPQTNKDPSDSEIAAVYEEGKDRDPFDQSPKPAFHRRYSAKFEYLVGNFQTFLDAEMDQLSEEVLRAEYEKQLKGGEFQLTDSAIEDLRKQMQAAADDKPSAEEPSAEEPSADKPSAEEKNGGTGDKPDDAAKKAEDAKAGDEKTDDVKTELGDGASADKAEAKEADQTGTNDPVNSVRLVVFQDKDGASDPPPAETGEDDTPEPAAKTEPDTPKADTPKADTPKEKSPPAEASTGEPKTKPFEDVRDTIAATLAAPVARKKMGEAMAKAEARMKGYLTAKSIHDGNVMGGGESEPPAMLDLKALGDELGLQHETIGPYDAASLSRGGGAEPIARSMSAGLSSMSGGPLFGMIMFGYDDGQSPPILRQPLYSRVRTIDSQTGKEYVSWKTEETESYTPPLSETRDEVIMAIRKREARKLAIEAAEKLAEKANAASDTPLADVVPDEKKQDVQNGVGPFSWVELTGMQGATTSIIPQLDLAGAEFMKTVFRTSVGQCGVAMNQGERVVFVVKPTSFEPSTDELRRQFKQPTGRMMATIMVRDQESTTAIIQGFYESVDDETGFSESLQE